MSVREMPGQAVAPVLEVDGLHVSFPPDHSSRPGGTTRSTVHDVSLTLRSGRTLGLIGESGCGKTMTAQAIVGLVPAPGRVRARRLMLHHPGTGEAATDLSALDPDGEQMRRVRGGRIAVVFQDAAASLSPVRTVGGQLREAIRIHRPMSRSHADRVAAELLDRVGVPVPHRRLREYPHQLSGGMSQRVAIALALCGEPDVLIADEPTTALDPELQHQIVELIRHLQSHFGMAVLYITHDVGLVEAACDEVAVMYLGRIVEAAPAREILTTPLHPYTRGLLASVPRLGQRRRRLPMVRGAVPISLDLGDECAFADRCDEVIPPCRQAVPALVEVKDRHRVRCYLHSLQQEGVAE